MKKIVIATAFFLASLPAPAQVDWFSAEDIEKANQNMNESFVKSKAAESRFRDSEQAPQPATRKNIVTYVPTANDIRRQAEEVEAEHARAIATARLDAQLREEKRLRDIARIEQQERLRQEREYQLRALELQQRQQIADQQEARLRLLERQAAQAQEQSNQRDRPLNCFSYGGGFTTCN